MAGTALTDLATALAAVADADQALGLATGVNVKDQINAISAKITDAALMTADLISLTLSAGLDAALDTVATDLT